MPPANRFVRSRRGWARHYIRVLQLLMRHPTTRIDRAIGMLIHKRTATAELIAQTEDRLADNDGAGPVFRAGSPRLASHYKFLVMMGQPNAMTASPV